MDLMIVARETPPCGIAGAGPTRAKRRSVAARGKIQRKNRTKKINRGTKRGGLMAKALTGVNGQMETCRVRQVASRKVRSLPQRGRGVIIQASNRATSRHLIRLIIMARRHKRSGCSNGDLVLVTLLDTIRVASTAIQVATHAIIMRRTSLSTTTFRVVKSRQVLWWGSTPVGFQHPISQASSLEGKHRGSQYSPKESLQAGRTGRTGMGTATESSSMRRHITGLHPTKLEGTEVSGGKLILIITQIIIL